jgi:hypothetical protein
MTIKLHHNKLSGKTHLTRKIECFVCGNVGHYQYFFLSEDTFHYMTTGWIRCWTNNIVGQYVRLRYHCPKCKLLECKLPEECTDGTK